MTDWTARAREKCPALHEMTDRHQCWVCDFAATLAAEAYQEGAEADLAFLYDKGYVAGVAEERARCAETPENVERIARAICTEQGEPCWKAHRIQAKEVLAALRAGRGA